MIVAIRHISKYSVGDVIHIADERGITYDDVSTLDEDAVYHMFCPDKHAAGNLYYQPDYEYIHKELKHFDMTLKLLWQEYQEKVQSRRKAPDGIHKVL